MSGGADVVSIYGGGMTPLSAAEPHADLIAQLELLLDQAKRGEVQCVAWAAQHSCGDCSQQIVGRWSGHALAGALHMTLHEMTLFQLGLVD